MKKQSPIIPPLTGIRFLAALMVVLGHGSGMMPESMPQGIFSFYLAQLAPIGMSLFFVLSGFVIWINYAEVFKRTPFMDACRQFSVARFARLYPMYLFTILLAVAVSGLTRFFQHAPWPAFVFTMLQSWIPGGNGLMAAFGIDWAGHLWSVSTEMFFYSSFPFLVFLLYRLNSISGIFVTGLVNVAASSIAFYLAFRYAPNMFKSSSINLGGNEMAWLTYYSPYLRIFEFIGGCLAAILFMKFSQGMQDKEQREIAVKASMSTLLFLFALLPICLVLIKYVPNQSFRLTFAARLGALLIFPALLVHVSVFDTGFSKLLGNRVMQWGGESSYSIYLLHTFFISNFSFHPGDTVYPGEFAFRMVMYVSLVTLISWGTYMWLEKPMRVYFRNVFSIRHPALA